MLFFFVRCYLCRSDDKEFSKHYPTHIKCRNYEHAKFIAFALADVPDAEPEVCVYFSEFEWTEVKNLIPVFKAIETSKQDKLDEDFIRRREDEEALKAHYEDFDLEEPKSLDKLENLYPATAA